MAKAFPEPGWSDPLFPYNPTASEIAGHACGHRQMLTLVAYDITDPKRLNRVARVCQKHGVRVQYSVFECRLDSSHFDSFWKELVETIDKEADRIVAYTVCMRCARDIRDAGVMTHSTKVVAYVC